MKQIKYIIILVLIFPTSNTFGQDSSRWTTTEDQAKNILNETLSDSTLHNVIGNEIILKDKVKAVKFAEMILFEEYGKQNIKRQKPYDVFEIEGYWLISGTLPIERKGGTFMIIIDARNYQIVRLTHGK